MATKKAVKAKFLVREVPIADLVLDDKNPRLHGERNLNLVRDLWQEVGQVEVLVVQKGTMRVIAGHGRIEVCKRLGQKTVFVHELEVTDEQAKKLGVAMNRSAELATWDPQFLDEVLDELEGFEIDAESLGFTDQDLANLQTAVNALDDDGDEDDEGAGDQSGELEDNFQVLVLCRNENEQADLLQRLTGEGWKCRALNS